MVLLHGFTQRGEIWADIAVELTRLGWQVETPDLPGHGPEVSRDAMGIGDTADKVAGYGAAVYVGYSLGARVILDLAARRSDVLQHAIAIGPRLALVDPAERRAHDEDLAQRIELHGVERFVDEWLQLDFNRRVPEQRRYRDLRISNRADGLASSLRNCGLATMKDLELSAPVTVLVGEHDFAEVRTDAERLSADNDVHVIPDVGHSSVFELPPGRFAELLDGYARHSA